MAAARRRARVRAVRALVVVAVLLLAVAGCGGGSDADAARTAWRDAAAAVADGDSAGFCSLVSRAGQQLLTHRTRLSCEDSVRVLGGLLSGADKASIRDATIVRVEVRGDTAVVTYDVSPALSKLGFTGRTTLERSGDQWLLSGV